MFIRTLILVAVLALHLAGTPAQCDEVALEAEAARFAKESQTLHGLKRYAEALETAEVAFALHPESKTCQERLIEALLCMSVETVYKGGMFLSVDYDAYGAGYSSVTADQMRRSLEYASRAAEIQEKYALYHTGRLTMTRVRGIWYNLHRHRTQALESEIAAFNRRVFDQWIKKVYEPAAEWFFNKEENKETREEFDLVLCRTILNTAKFQTYGDSAALFETTAKDILRAKIEWNGLHSQNALAYLLRDLVAFASMYRNLPPEKRCPEVGATLERIAAMFDNDPRLAVQIYAWLIRNKVCMRSYTDASKMREAANAYSFQLGEKIKSLPPGISEKEFSILYDEAGGPSVITYCYADKLLRCTELLEIANSRNEWVGHSMLGLFLDWVRFEKNSPTGNVPEHFSSAITGQIEIGKKVAPDKAKALELSAIAAGHYVPQDIPAKPWKEEIILFKSPQWSRICRSLLRNDILYLFVNNYREGTVSLVSIDLKTMKKKEYPGALRFTTGGASLSYVDNTNAYLGNRRDGVSIFPLDGSEPWSLGQKDGLPGLEIHGLGSMHSELYVGLDDEQGRSWLIAIDVKTRNWEILISSTAKEGKTPFVNMGLGPRFRAFFEDVERNRLLMFIDVYTSNDGLAHSRNDKRFLDYRGLWSMDGKTREFIQLKPWLLEPSPGHIPVGEDRVLFGGSYGAAMLLDLTKTECDDACQYLCDKESRYQFNGGTFYRGQLWGRIYPKGDPQRSVWAKLTDGNSEPELLKIPESIKASGWMPSAICRATSDGKNLVVGDDNHVILLRFEDP
jgi:hypothetical protein